MSEEALFGGIEAGGTKFVCILGAGPKNIVQQVRIATTTPQETLGKVIQFFQTHMLSRQIDGIGLAVFGPADINPKSPTYGRITNTPKPGWRDTDILGVLQRALKVKMVIDMDVNAAAFGEFSWGASRGYDPSLYLTIGTGIGGGYIKDGKPMTGMLNLELGHIRIPHSSKEDPFLGSCPFHGDCFEGLASGPAIEKRLGIAGATVRDSDAFWDVEARYIALALLNYILVLSPSRIILGGGVMQREFLFPKIRRIVQELLNGYVASRSVVENIDDYIVPPGLGNRSGSLGAIALAKLAQG
jgi:fructokinase